MLLVALCNLFSVTFVFKLHVTFMWNKPNFLFSIWSVRMVFLSFVQLSRSFLFSIGHSATPCNPEIDKLISCGQYTRQLYIVAIFIIIYQG